MAVDPWYNSPTPADQKLTYLSIALLGDCNADCIFCYVNGDRDGALTPEKLRDVFDEAKELGMEKVQLSGGEPLMYPHLEEILAHLEEQHVTILMATNGMLVTPKKAAMLARFKVGVGVSFETIDERVSDELSNVPGSHRLKLAGIENLREAGYTKDLPLNIIMKTLKQNLPTYIPTWRWALDKGIQPILDRAIPGVRCKPEWVVSPTELKYLLDEISVLQGTPHRIPFVNNEGCNRMSCGIHVEVDGAVYPCAGLPIKMGDVNTTSLRDIWLHSDVATMCRDYKARLYGSCKTCEETEICSGCRAVAYATTGNMFGPDLLCWKNEAK